LLDAGRRSWIRKSCRTDKKAPAFLHAFDPAASLLPSWKVAANVSTAALTLGFFSSTLWGGPFPTECREMVFFLLYS
jgi:hypothetical protein